MNQISLKVLKDQYAKNIKTYQITKEQEEKEENIFNNTYTNI